MELSVRDRTDVVVVRGQNVAGTLRMAALVTERFLRDPELFDPKNAYPPDWADLWAHKTSTYEKTFNRNNWVSIHVGGQTAFTTRDSNHIKAIERLAEGADLDESMLRTATCGMFGDLTPQDVVVQHESQTAVVVTHFSEYIRAAVLERKGGRTGSFSVSVRHTPQRKARPHAVMNFSADIIESYNLRQFLQRAPEGSDSSAPEMSAGLHQQIASATARRKQLKQYIEGFERANKIQYRPERPEI